ncbi:orotidine 5'-phosphate decarboxylase [Alicyclobacillus cellulosilyticus]|uniref:Orotidine 5'-phosphate decarboxylase n=1 Tax=Alicyclobacillus cellulosilyticus TaxID=1003997 RepID=A0A917K1A3_9BACL|nr:orotidine-5'-phosphate decarboxylase [Alicyclobacillus cellulosilyticus]GGI97396.1 orotidine 5'-phosphate decarboxylase [Alicyclobacillus cellulosilyticus]
MEKDAALLTHPRYDWARRHSYVALDVPDGRAALAWVRRLGPGVTGYKVGMELFYAEGPRFLTRLVSLGKRVFLDLKLHDIPTTVARALKVLAPLGVEMVNVHASAGRKALAAACEAVAVLPDRPLLIAVTVLTSLDAAACTELGWSAPEETAVRLARMAAETGCDGVVASAHDVPRLTGHMPAGFEFVVPGIRPPGVARDDQARAATPGEAVSLGATRLVLGRAVTRAADPVAALLAIWDEMTAAHTSRTAAQEGSSSKGSFEPDTG